MSEDSFIHNRERFRPRYERFRPDPNRFRRSVEKRPISSPTAPPEEPISPPASETTPIQGNERPSPSPTTTESKTGAHLAHWTKKNEWMKPKTLKHQEKVNLPPEIKTILTAFSQNRALSDVELQKFARFAHLAGLLGALAAVFGIVCSVILWFKFHGNEIISRHCKESLNFQISAIAYRFLLGFLDPDAPMAFNLFYVFTIVILSGNAAKGEEVRYPFCFRFIK